MRIGIDTGGACTDVVVCASRNSTARMPSHPDQHRAAALPAAIARAKVILTTIHWLSLRPVHPKKEKP
jgi:N-methylhydantoinase A/oxoprolinase/acetone carboxylase beta subunit